MGCLKHTRFGILGLALLGVTSLLPGCGIDAGFNPVIDEAPSSATFRVETEIVPNARLVREDTMPRWQAGRYAYVQGSDNLVVLTHVTSLADYDDETELFVNRRDHATERLWIAVPEDTKLGDLLDAEVMENKYRIGYDAGLVGDGQFIEPWKTTGSLTLLEDKPDKMVVYLNLLVSPKRRPNWSVQGVFEIEKNTKGIYAQPLPPDVRELYLGSAVAKSQPVVDISKNSTTTPVEQAAQQAQAKADDAAPKVENNDDKNQEPANFNKNVVGMWENVTPTWYERYQFNPDGTLIHANCRPGYDPAINTGTWMIKNEKFLVITVTAYTYGKIGATSVDSRLLTGPSVGYLTMTWQKDGKLHLQGNVWRRTVEPLDMTFSRASFVDMAIVPPPSRW